MPNAVENKQEITPDVKLSKDKEAYLMWRSIPALLRVMKEQDLRNMGYPMDDPAFVKLLSIRNDFQFTREFGLDKMTPSRWEGDPDFAALINKVSMHDHVLRFGKDVDFAFTQKTIKYGDSGRVKLWNQLYRGWTEKTQQNVAVAHFDPIELVERLEREKRLAKQPELSDN